MSEPQIGPQGGPRRPDFGIYPTLRLGALFTLPLALLLATPLVPPLRELALGLNILGFLLLIIDYRRAQGARALNIRRVLHQRLSLGTRNRITIQVANPSGRPIALRIVDDAPPTFTIEGAEHVLALAPGEERALHYSVTPHRRGDYQFLAIHVELLGPWGLARRVFRVPAEATVKVYPNLQGVEQWKLLTRRRHLSDIGVHRIRKRGSGSEFETLRLYTQDDEYRHIHWKATARRHLPITSVYQTEKSQSIVVLLDAGRRMAAWVGGLSKLDYAINASLLLAYVASMGDDNIALGVFNSELRTWLGPRKGRMQYRRFMEQLYACEADLVFTNYRAAFVEIAQKINKRSLVVIMTDVLDPDAAADLERAVSIFRPRHLPLVISLRDPSLEEIAARDPIDGAELFETVVAQELYLERRKMAQDIRRKGVHILDAAPADFSISVVNEYLRLKARHEL